MRTSKLLPFLLRIFRGGLAVAALALVPACVWAQGTPAQLTDPHGDNPFGSYQVSDLDQIAFANGALDVRIPLFGRAGRGLGHQKFFHYSNKAWFPDFGPPCDSSVLQCPPPMTPVWSYSDNGMKFSNGSLYPSPCGSGGFGTVQEYANFTYVDEAGSPHLFNAVTTPRTPVPSCIHQKLRGYAIDGSGMTIDVTDFVNPVVTLKDGSRVGRGDTSLSTFLHKDASGNMIVVDGNISGGAYGEIDTLGRDVRHVITSLANGASYEDWITKDSGGNDQRMRIEWVYLPVCTNFQQGGVLESCGSGGIRLASKLDLPNGMAYQFTYDTGTTPGHYGELLRIDLPLGGYVRYEYAPISTQPADSSTRVVTKRAVSADGTAASEKIWTYSYQLLTPDTLHSTTVVTDPDGNQTAHVSASSPFLAANMTPVETEVRSYQGTTTSGVLLRTVKTDYSFINTIIGDRSDGITYALSRPIRVTTILDNGLTTKVETDYDPAPDNNGVISYNRSNVIERREYDYGQGAPGPLLRRTDYTYLHNSNSAYATANIVNKVTSVIVYDGQSNIVAQTQNTYDGGTLTSTSGGAPNHDYTNFGPSNTVRGNLTQVSRWRNTDNTWQNTSFTYDDLGNVLSVTDPLQHTTNYSYLDSWSGAGCVPAGVNTLGLLTQITNALGFRTQASYYPCPGLMQSKRDENDIRASRAGTVFTYDNLNRLLTATSVEGAQTSFNFHGDALPLQVTKSALIASGQSVANSTTYDGAGRAKTSSLDTDPSGADTVDTTYDNLGRVATVSNPHRAAAAPTDGVTQTQYDALGRATRVTKQDGSVSTVSYSGNCTTSADEAGKQRRGCSDALGRLIEVDEPGDPYAGTASSGSLAVSGTLQSIVTGAHGATGSSGSVTISGTDANFQDTSDPSQCVPNRQGLIVCPTVYDFGSFVVTVGGFAVTASYGQASTPQGLATTITNGFNVSGSPVHASLSGSTVSFTSVATGAATNYAMSWSSTTGDPADFSNGASFGQTTQSGATMTGGTDAFGGNTTYDYGKVTATVNGFTASACYGPNPNCTGNNNTAALVAASLASALSAAGSPVHASASGSSISIAWNTPGAAGNVTVSCSSATQSSPFSSASFTCPASTSLTGGTDPEGISLDHNFFVTLYTYDTLGNLLTVTQKGDPAVNTQSQWRVRTFTYNSLSQLLTATNPESGTITYTYDNNGNLLTKAAPAPNQTGSATVTTTYVYDALNRLTQKSFSDGTTPTVKYGYDAVAPAGCTLPTLTINNGIGKRTSMCDAAGSEAWSYDITANVGWKTTDARTTNGVTKTTIVQSNLSGGAATLTYPSGRIVTYAYNTAAQPLSAMDNLSVSYASGALYAPTGALASLTSGASVTSTLFYDKRLQPCRISVKNTGGAPGSCADGTNIGNVLDYTYNFSLGSSDNGNVMGITNNRDTTRSQSFTYDPLNRIATAKTQATTGANAWGLQFGYDPWGNLLTQSLTQGSAPILNVSANTNNRLAGYSYDAAGNMLSDGSSSYTYNGEGEMASAAGVTYTYDGDGKRVSKSNGKLYWYGVAGDPLDETDAAGNTNNSSFAEYIFFGGRRIAKRDSSGTVNYYFADHLGSARVVASATGSILDDSDFYPYGGERPVVSSSGNRYKFDGKERDAETGNDNFGARSYSPTLGRWLSSDWSAVPVPVPYANLANPQTLNLYAMVHDNPETFADLDGHTINRSFSSLDAPTPNDDGGPNDTVVARQLALMSDYTFGWKQEAVQQQAQQQQQTQSQNSAASPSLSGPYVADLKSPQIAPLLDPNHKPSDSDVVGPNGECVDLTKKFSGMGDVSAGHHWYRGEKVADAKDIKPGTAIANFNDKGRFPNKHEWNSGIYLGRGTNGSIWILDQWPGHSPTPRELLLDNRRMPADNAGAYFVILTGPWR